jgi:hypothetical protein
MNRYNSTGFGQLSSFSIVCLIILFMLNSDTLRRVIVQAEDLNLQPRSIFFFFWWGLLHGPQQGPDRMKEKNPIRLGKGKPPA